MTNAKKDAEKLRRWKTLAKKRGRMLAAQERNLTRILCDVKYKGGVQFWIQKHDELLLRYQQLYQRSLKV